MKTIALFGATGRSGLPLLKKALELGFNVKVLVRNPEKLGAFKDKVQFIIGDVGNYDNVVETINNTDVVISVIGHVKGSPPLFQTRGVQNMLKAMKEHGIKRIISLTGAGVFGPFDHPGFIDKLFGLIIKTIAKDRYEDGVRHAEEIMKTNLDWTIVRVPRLTDGKRMGKYVVGQVGDSKMRLSITREDVSKFILDIIEDKKFYKKMPYVSN